MRASKRFALPEFLVEVKLGVDSNHWETLFEYASRTLTFR